jgi:hypothetical protein
MAEKGKKDGATPQAEAPFTMNTTTDTSFSLGTAPAGQGDLSTAVTVSSFLCLDAAPMVGNIFN